MRTAELEVVCEVAKGLLSSLTGSDLSPIWAHPTAGLRAGLQTKARSVGDQVLDPTGGGPDLAHGECPSGACRERALATGVRPCFR